MNSDTLALLLTSLSIRHLVIVGGVLWALALAASIPVLMERGSVLRWAGWGQTSPGSIPKVSAVQPGGPADGILKVGDRIIAIDGKTMFAAYATPGFQVWTYPPGTRYQVTVEREGQVMNVALRVTSRVSSRWPLIWSFLFGSLAFSGIAWLMGWQRPELLLARLGWIASQMTAFLYIDLALSIADGGAAWKPSLTRMTLNCMADAQQLLVFAFVANFPYSLPASRIWRNANRTILALYAVYWVFHQVSSATYLGPLGKYFLLPGWWESTYAIVNASLKTALIVAIVGVLIRNYRAMTEPGMRRRIEIVAGAIAVAILISSGASAVSRLQGISLPPWANLAPLPVPFCFAYAVLRHQVMDIRLVLRRSLRYLLARQILRTLTLLPLALMVIRALADPTAPIGSLFNLAGVALVLAAALALEFRDRIQQALDRWYFRETLLRERQLRMLLIEIAEMQSWIELEEKVPRRLTEIFNLESARFDDQGTLKLGSRHGEEPYSVAEQDMLSLLAAQIRLVHEKLMMADSRDEAIQSERQRIAREVHDTAGHGFAGIALYMDAARMTFRSGAAEAANQYLEQAGALARKSLQETRQSIAGWRDPHGTDLEGRLRAMARGNESGLPAISVKVQDGATQRASADVHWHLARIAEEAITNALKYADAKQIRVEVEDREQGLLLRVSDDGAGFDPAHASGRGYGLSGMRERMAQLRGTLTISSAPGKGTEICAEVPA